MRGQARCLRPSLPPGRITPEDAGTRISYGNISCYSEDHPRGCGDKFGSEDQAVQSGGSPPRMRGQELLFHQLLLVYRITPADAGTSNSARSFTVPLLDHPRGCGDKFVAAVSWESPTGSPPRMRGQGPESIFGILLHRITPADAGTRLHPLLSPLATWDHPRGCGDK